MEGLVMTGQVLLALTILIGLHEWGHYAAARMFKIKVEKFYLFFDFLFPLPSVLNFAIFKKQVGDTEFGLGWFPLGGYVKIAGMMDESMDKEALAAPAQEWEFRSKPAWQRLIVMLGGIIVNVVLGVFIFICISIVTGESYYKMEDVNKNGIAVNKIAEEMGLQNGDKILKINGQAFEKFDEVRSSKVLLADGSFYTVLRNGQEVNVVIPTNLMEKLSDAKKDDANFIEPLYLFEIEEVVAGSPASAAGLEKGDRILTIDSLPTPYFQDLQRVLAEKKGKKVALLVARQNTTKFLTATVSEDGKIGVRPKMLLEPATRAYGLGEAAVKGTKDAFGVIGLQLVGFGKIFKGELSPQKALSGPIGIAKVFGGTWNWLKFWSLTAMLSMVLAFMNLLPIPALDGGHALFLCYEIIVGKAPSEKFLERSQQFGMLILLCLMAFAFGNDIYKLIF
jgi:regulator of sigma E protease